MAKPRKKRNDAKENTEEMLREYWETIEAEPRQGGAKSDNFKKTSQDESSDG